MNGTEWPNRVSDRVTEIRTRMNPRIPNRIRIAFVIAATVCAAGVSVPIFAQQSQAVKAESAPTTAEPAKKPISKEAETTTEPNVPSTAKEEHKKQLVTVGMLLLVGVSLIGMILIGMTIAWGGRLRRIARKPLPPQSPVDELWYLKAKKNPSAAGASKDDSPDAGSESPSDQPESP